jgi:ADP-heptose:LPS heptosyltransferase
MKILFISANRIGDAVLNMGVLAWLQNTYPEAQFTIAAGPVTHELYRAVPRIDALINLKKQKRHGHWIDLWTRCIGTRWDIIVDLRNSIISRLLFSKKRYVKLAKPTGRHKLEDHASILGLQTVPLPKIWIDSAAQDQADALVPAGAPVLALGPASNWVPKSWDIRNFIELTERLYASSVIAANTRLMIAAAPHERTQVQPLIDAFPKEQIIDIIGADLLTVAACLEKACLFIGNDSGLMHMASAMKVPTVGLFGPSDDRIYGPYGKKCLAIRTPETREQLFALQPYPGADTPLLMGTLSVERVMEGVISLISR